MAEKVSRVAKAFITSKIVPDLITNAPKFGINIHYPTAEVNEGNKLTPKETKEQPLISWCTNPASLYSLFMIDPDAPSPKKPSQRGWLHWFVGNISGNDLRTAETICEYVGAAPPKDSGFHRYVYLIFAHKGKINYTIDVISKSTADGRPCFKILQLADRFKLGDPVAGNYFLAEYDDSVPEIYKQLGVDV